MNIDEFRVRGKEMIEYICEYIRTLEGKRVTANVDPGYLRHLMPNEAPFKPESWDAIMRDVDGKIMPGVSYLPAIVADDYRSPFSLSLSFSLSPLISTLLPPLPADINNIRAREREKKKEVDKYLLSAIFTIGSLEN